MTKTEQTIKTILGPSLSKRVLAKMARERRRKRDKDAIDEITKTNGGYFLRPEDPDRVDDKLSPDGPEQLSLDLDMER